MTNGTYTVRRDEMPQYILKTIQEQVCPVLLPCGIFAAGEDLITICPEEESRVPLSAMLTGSGAILSGYRDLLSAIRCILSAALECRSWFIPDRYISLEPEDLFFSRNKGSAGLLLKPCSEPFEERLLALVKELAHICPDSNADVLYDRIRAEGPAFLKDKRTVLKVLGQWEEEIRR